MQLLARKVRSTLCGFLEPAKGHTGSFTTGAGTFCSTCHERVFNPRYSGARDVEGDMEIVAKLRKTGTRIPKAIQEEISEFQDEVGWEPRWKW